MDIKVAVGFFLVSAFMLVTVSFVLIKLLRKFMKPKNINGNFTNALTASEILSASLLVFMQMLMFTSVHTLPGSWVAQISEGFGGKVAVGVLMMILFPPMVHVLDRYVWFSKKGKTPPL
ncbi:hypothetical protein [Alkalimarinus alittae]|uniref:Uncharacterized protein n=1 Tax=Alkalimarinus alittae TaxID=2961619 RepID=A0ABY6N1N8_9ALTE|nr:hypothetical protein [Alkalimarinus alittae]UZE95914.1 hypothetical protein NKI27_17990 [Alkalimarinus alittae]